MCLLLNVSSNYIEAFKLRVFHHERLWRLVDSTFEEDELVDELVERVYSNVNRTRGIYEQV